METDFGGSIFEVMKGSFPRCQLVLGWIVEQVVELPSVKGQSFVE